ncbi:O-succinylbenzoic acid--CoA ligase [Polaribacter reichenbachii]|uniref:O-succinylbenzoic acid--CoA ligase n=1 Tax=Polaribacter reichenbachii TaxID=996801 RepID=A0A1B8U4G8_9FLAO|nr:AMP-binding protein [Polaribacter reichenbachii]APZ47505.1 O-succinylbenzoic acid--CoA ligase [Polaribacter reichenbachii]AUC18144.1 O-succinylbenzoic acid--CoA ligase [Polaribacter reichenbachii]OBY66755.1 O-succinylbenzoic acid--CoA ligase [Polaribacter reichenbachii]
MKLEQNKFHKNFKLNGVSFSSVDEILSFSKSVSDDIHLFLQNWFSDEKVIIVKTSGSTGTPKSIQLKKELMVNSAKATGNYFNLPQYTKALLCLPIVYIAGKMMLIRGITLGWHLDVIESTSNPLEKISKEYDFSAMVPLQVENSLSKLNLIKQLIVGGGVVSNTLQTKLQALNTKIFATYGMTETITHIAVKKLNNFSNQNSNLVENLYYETLPNVTIYRDERNCLVIEAPKVSEEIIFTNDVVQLISDKHFNWLGRFDNVINSGGVKLHLEKIEEKLSKIITNRFFVTGIYDEILGEKLVLIIEGNKQEISLKNSSLSKFEKPKEIYFIDNFKETETGKIQRKRTIQQIVSN